MQTVDLLPSKKPKQHELWNITSYLTSTSVWTMGPQGDRTCIYLIMQRAHKITSVKQSRGRSWSLELGPCFRGRLAGWPVKGDCEHCSEGLLKLMKYDGERDTMLRGYLWSRHGPVRHPANMTFWTMHFTTLLLIALFTPPCLDSERQFLLSSVLTTTMCAWLITPHCYEFTSVLSMPWAFCGSVQNIPLEVLYRSSIVYWFQALIL